MHKGMATIGDACQLFWLRKYGGVIKEKVHCRRFQVKDVGSSYTIKTYTSFRDCQSSVYQTAFSFLGLGTCMPELCHRLGALV